MTIERTPWQEHIERRLDRMETLLDRIHENTKDDPNISVECNAEWTLRDGDIREMVAEIITTTLEEKREYGDGDDAEETD